MANLSFIVALCLRSSDRMQISLLLQLLEAEGIKVTVNEKGEQLFASLETQQSADQAKCQRIREFLYALGLSLLVAQEVPVNGSMLDIGPSLRSINNARSVRYVRQSGQVYMKVWKKSSQLASTRSTHTQGVIA